MRYPTDLEFVSSYQGEAHYRDGQHRYRVRYWAPEPPHIYAPDIFENEILPAVGTVRCDTSNDFPPDDVMDRLRTIYSDVPLIAAKYVRTSGGFIVARKA